MLMADRPYTRLMQQEQQQQQQQEEEEEEEAAACLPLQLYPARRTLPLRPFPPFA